MEKDTEARSIEEEDKKIKKKTNKQARNHYDENSKHIKIMTISLNHP